MACPTLQNFQQTMFLGCTVEGHSCNLGWGEQVSEVNVRLVRDTCPSPAGTNKIYYDLNTNPRNPQKSWTAADPGLACFGAGGNEYPRLGSPVYYRLGDFEFCGLLQDWVNVSPNSDKDEYDVKIVSPMQILDGTQVIISEYAGAVKGFNILNVYGFWENFSTKTAAPFTDERYPQDGVIFGSPTGGIGGADLNESGMSWNKVKNGVAMLTSSFLSSASMGFQQYSEYGRLSGVGSNNNPKFGLLASDFINVELGTLLGVSNNVCFYYIDLSDIPNTPDDFRIAGPNASLLSILTEVTTAIGYEYYVELMPVAVGNSVMKVIKVRTISRQAQPTLGVVEQYIENVTQVIDSSYGREFRNESTTNFIVGGQKQNLWQVESGVPDPDDDPDEEFLEDTYSDNQYVRRRIEGFYGTDTEGNIYVEYEDETQEVGSTRYINADLRGLKRELQTVGDVLPDSIRIREDEFRTIPGGFNSWSTHLFLVGTELGDALRDVPGLHTQIQIRFFGIAALNLPGARARDFIAFRGADVEIDAAVEDLRKIFSFVESIYENYRSYLMVRLPNISVYKRNDDLILSDEVADGGWTEAENVLGIPLDDGLLSAFRNEDGTIVALSGYDFSTGENNGIHIGEEGETVDYVLYNNKLIKRISVLNEIQFLDRTNYRSPRVIVERPRIIELEEVNPIFQGWRNLLAANPNLNVLQNEISDEIKGPEGELLKFAAENDLLLPNRVAIPTISNVLTYGPWKPNNVLESGPPGQIRYTKDDSLVPWQYGSYDAMDLVGQARANVGVSLMTEAERGQVTIAGIPTVPLGSELASLTGLGDQFYNNNAQLVENRVATAANTTLTSYNGQEYSFTQFYVPYGAWTSAYGPTVTGITVTVSPSEVSTTYIFRTFSPKWGSLAKINADRIAQRLQWQNQRRNVLRVQRALKQLKNSNAKALKRRARAEKIFEHNNWRRQQGTPHSAFVADISTWGSSSSTPEDEEYRRTIICTKHLHELRNNSSDNSDYDNLAIMSFDGLFRPISMDGDGGLPEYATPTNDGSDATLSRRSHPYFTGGRGYGLIINQDYLNPLSNPIGFSRATINNRQPSDCGHDIEILARNSLTDFENPDKSLVMPSDSGGWYSADRADYADDYRFLGLRGPIMIHGWGYDLDGKPIPNEADNEVNASAGVFVNTGLKDQFLDKFLRKSDTWPVAPLDVRYDRSRGVWCSPPSRRPLCVTLKANIGPFSSGVAEIDDGQTYYDATGGTISDRTVIIKDCVGETLVSGDKAVVDYNEFGKYYNIIHTLASGTSSEQIFAFQLTAPMSLNGPATGVQVGFTDSGESFVIDPTPRRIDVPFQNMYGPCPSGFYGWAVNNDTNITGTGVGLPEIIYSMINIETVPEFIEFSIDASAPPTINSSTYVGTAIRTWNGREDDGGVYAVRFPDHFNPQLGLLQVSGVQGTAVINRNESQKVSDHFRYFYDVVNLFGVNVTGTSTVVSLLEAGTNPPQPDKRYSVIEFGANLNARHVNQHHIRVSAESGINITGTNVDVTLSESILNPPQVNNKYSLIEFGKNLNVRHVSSHHVRVAGPSGSSSFLKYGITPSGETATMGTLTGSGTSRVVCPGSGLVDVFIETGAGVGCWEYQSQELWYNWGPNEITENSAVVGEERSDGRTYFINSWCSPFSTG